MQISVAYAQGRERSQVLSSKVSISLTFCQILVLFQAFFPLSLSYPPDSDFITNSLVKKKLADFDLNEFVGIFAQLFSLINFKAGSWTRTPKERNRKKAAQQS